MINKKMVFIFIITAMIGLSFSACAERVLDTYNPGLAGVDTSREAAGPVFNNGGFETWQGTTIAVSWAPAFHSDGPTWDDFEFDENIFDVYRQQVGGQEGFFSLEIGWSERKYDNPIVYQIAEIMPGSNYVFSFYAKTTEGAPEVCSYIRWLNNSMEVVDSDETTSSVPAASWTQYQNSNTAPWTAKYAYFCVKGYAEDWTPGPSSGKLLIDGATLAVYGGGVAPEPVDPETFKGPYAAVTTSNYDASFKGANGIGDLLAALEGSADGYETNGSWDIKAVITGLTGETNYITFDEDEFFIQDSTGAIYVYKSGGSIESADQLGQVITATVTQVKNYFGTYEITAMSGVSITATGAPAAVYAKEITSISASDLYSVVKYTGTVTSTASNIELDNGDLPDLRNNFDSGYKVGDVITVIGPLEYYNGTYQVDDLDVWPQLHMDGSGTYSVRH